MTIRANLLTRLLSVVVAAAALTAIVLRIADQQPATSRGLILTCTGVPVAIGLALLLGEMLVHRPMRRIVAAAKRWSAGDTAARVALHEAPTTEFGRMAAAFNLMADTVDRERAEAARLHALLQKRAAEPTLRLDDSRDDRRIAFAEPARKSAGAPWVAAAESLGRPPARARLLIVDDDADIRVMAGEILREIGHVVVLAADGAEALATLERDSDFALMLADYAMPGLNGLMLIEAVGARYPAIRTLLITGYAEFAEADAMPAERIVRKPFTIATLAGCVREALSGRSRRLFEASGVSDTMQLDPLSDRLRNATFQEYRTAQRPGGFRMTTANHRTADHAIDPLFLERWSPRAFTSEALSEAELLTILEAARWAPSSYNSQPWRFLYALRDTPDWSKFLGLLIEFNQSWAQRAGALVIVVSSETMRPPGGDKDVPAYSHSFDAGAAWGNLALQAARSGFQAHGMVGFDIPRAATELNVPAGYRVEAAIAIGRVGDKSILPEGLQAREAPSPRKPLSEIAFAGGFPPA